MKIDGNAALLFFESRYKILYQNIAGQNKHCCCKDNVNVCNIISCKVYVTYIDGYTYILVTSQNSLSTNATVEWGWYHLSDSRYNLDEEKGTWDFTTKRINNCQDGVILQSGRKQKKMSSSITERKTNPWNLKEDNFLVFWSHDKNKIVDWLETSLKPDGWFELL